VPGEEAGVHGEEAGVHGEEAGVHGEEATPRRCAGWSAGVNNKPVPCRWRVYPLDLSTLQGVSLPAPDPAVPRRDYCARHTREVVPCPVDPSHNVSLAKLHRHVNVCPKLVRLRQTVASPGHVPRINFPPWDERDGEDTMSSARTPGTDHKALALGGRKLVIKTKGTGAGKGGGKVSALQAVLQSVDPAPMQRVVRLVEKAHRTLMEACGSSCALDAVQQLEPEVLMQARTRMEASVHKDRPEAGIRAERAGQRGGGTQRGRHAVQHVSMLGHMMREGMMPAPGAPGCSRSTFVELGCGRGYLSAMAGYAWQKDVHVVLVDREPARNKADKHLRENGSGVTRIRADIGHLWLPAVLPEDGVNGGGGGESGEPPRRPFVAASKHLCGAATDYALRCCVNASRAADMQGLAIAACCRHLCDFHSYANRPLMERLGFSENDFHVMSYMCAWPGSIKGGRQAGVTRDVEAEGPPAAGELMSHAEKLRIGNLAIQVIDLGRVLWLEEQGMRAKIVKFVHEEETAENRLLLALPA